MSSVSSQAPLLYGNYEDLIYDQNFTADISNKMRVPNRILVTGDGKDNAEDLLASKITAELGDKVPMHVPDRIVVAGQDQHIGMKAPPRELRLERNTSPQLPPIRVETPPRILTLEDHYFPTVDDGDESDDNKGNPDNRIRPLPTREIEPRSEVLVPDTPPDRSFMDTCISPTEEVQMLHRQIRRLTRKVANLEHESHLRQQKEMIVLSFTITYFVLKVLRWLHQHW